MERIMSGESVSIIIPHYEHYDLTHALMTDIYYKERENISEIVLVNNGGTSQEVLMGQEYWRNMYETLSPNACVNIINITDNKGFLLAANLGLQEASGAIKILISNDVRIKGTFVSYVEAALFAPNLVGQKIYYGDTGWNNFNGKIYQYLEGFFLAAKGHMWEDLGYFDTRYVPSDYEDIDLSTTALSKGIGLVPLNLPYIEHLGAKTYGYNPEREAITKINREKFRAKWVE